MTYIIRKKYKFSTMIKLAIIAFLLLTTVMSGKIDDTMSFNNDWVKAGKENGVTLKWMSGNNCLEFLLKFPAITTSNIVTKVFLYDNKSPQGFIDAFNPLFDNTSIPGTSQFYQKINFADIDNKAKYPCIFKENTLDTVITCNGFMTAFHSSDLGATRADQFAGANNLGLVKWLFSLIVKVNKLVEGSVTTSVKTKVLNLPCVNCGCDNICTALTGFTASTRLCTDATCTATRDNIDFIFGETAFIEITTVPATRKFDIMELYANTGEEEGVQLKTSVIDSIKNDVAGKVIVTMPIAGPASTAGLNFGLKFILKAQKAVRRFRFLEAAPVEAMAANTAKVNVKEVVSNGTGTPLPPKEVDIATDKAQGILIGVLVLGCISVLLTVAVIFLGKTSGGNRN